MNRTKKLIVTDWNGNILDKEEYLINQDGELCRVLWDRDTCNIVPVSHTEGLFYHWEEYPLLKRHEQYTDDDEKGENHYFTKFKIVVSSEEDKQQLEEAFRYIHDQNIDTDYVTVNQLVHVYLERDNKRIVIDPTQFT